MNPLDFCMFGLSHYPNAAVLAAPMSRHGVFDAVEEPPQRLQRFCHGLIRCLRLNIRGSRLKTRRGDKKWSDGGMRTVDESSRAFNGVAVIMVWSEVASPTSPRLTGRVYGCHQVCLPLLIAPS